MIRLLDKVPVAFRRLSSTSRAVHGPQGLFIIRLGDRPRAPEVAPSWERGRDVSVDFLVRGTTGVFLPSAWHATSCGVRAKINRNGTPALPGGRTLRLVTKSPCRGPACTRQDRLPNLTGLPRTRMLPDTCNL